MYDFCLHNFNGIKEKDIIVLGRSMGTGPSIHLGCTRKPGILVTVCAYKSIRSVVQDKVSILSAIMSD